MELRSRRVLRLLLTLLAAFAFGAVAAWVADRGGDGRSSLSQLRGMLGNLSAPWLIVPFLAGRRCTGRLSGAAFGLVGSLLALSGFYLVCTWMTDLGEPTFLASLGAEVRANQLYFVWGCLTGPVCGAVGSALREAKAFTVGLLLGLLLAGEPIVLALMGALRPVAAPVLGSDLPLALRGLAGFGVTPSDGWTHIGVLLTELALGVVIAAASLRRRRAVVAAPPRRGS